MTTLALAIYAEGRTDERFLPIVIQRTAEQILSQRGRTSVDVFGPVVLNHDIERTSQGRAERILEAARRSAGYHALIVHADADYPSPDRATKERIQPGFDLVRRAKESVCHQLLPIIPVQMTEAWMLADPEALQQVIGTSLGAQALGLPAHAHQVESDPNPRQTFSQALQNALAHRPRRRRRIDLGTIYEPLARQINLERLGTVAAYQQFVHDMIEVLIALRLAK